MENKRLRIADAVILALLVGDIKSDIEVRLRLKIIIVKVESRLAVGNGITPENIAV